MKKGKVKLLSAAIMFSGLLAVSPAIADDETFPIEIIDKYEDIEGAGYSDKQINGSLYYVYGSSDAEEKKANLDFHNDQKFSADKYEFKNNSTTGNGTIISVEGHAKIDAIGGYTFSGNTAQGKGGVIYVNATKNGWAHIVDSSFENNKASLGSVIYTNSDVSISASEKDVLFNNNSGYAIYIDGNDVGMDLTTTKDSKITINDNIYIKNIADYSKFNPSDPSFSNIATGIELVGYYGNQGERVGAGTVEFNGKIDFVSNTGYSGFFVNDDFTTGTLKLGKTPATGSYSVISEAQNFTIDLQNNNAGDILTIPYLISIKEDGVLNFKIDYDAKSNLVDNVIINNIQHELLPTELPSVNFDLNNIVIFDDENWLDGSTRNIRYLTDNSGEVIDLTENGSYAFDDGTVYSFTVMKENKGTANVLREEKYVSLEEAIADSTTNGYTLRRGDYKLSDDSKGLGTISSEKTIFAINGNNNSLDGNKKDGITVATADQTLNINDVKEFKNFKTAVTNQSGIVNINNSTFIDNEIDLVNEKTTNITNSILNGVVQNNNGTINLTNSSIKNTVTNDGTFVVCGDSSVSNIDGKGALIVGDDIEGSKETKLSFDNENGITQTSVTINPNGNVSVYADKLVTKDGVKNDGTLTLKAQTATEEVPETVNNNIIIGDGTTIIDGGIIKSENSIGTKYILVNESATLKANADNVGTTGTTEKVTNNGTVSLSGGTLGVVVDGGKIALTGDVTSSADNLLGDITNDGNLTLTTGTLKKDIAESETGRVVIADGLSVVNEANINQLITVDGAQYETSADRIYDKDKAITALNASEIVLNGGTLKENRIVGEDASVYIKNKVTFDFDNSNYAENDILSNIDIDETGIFRPADTYTGENNTISFYDGSTIDLANGQINEVNLANLESNQTGDKLFILADYGDAFDSKKLWIEDIDEEGNPTGEKIEGNVVIKSLDLSNMQENDEESYQFTTNLKDNVKMELEEIKFSENTDKNSVYYTKVDGKIYIEKLDNLEQAIQKVQDNSTNLAYQMSGNEILNENKAIENEDMTIFGKGNSIEGKALTVGNGTDERKLILSDTNLKNTELNDGEKYSLIVKDKAMTQITAKDKDIAITGNINLEKDDNLTDSGKYKLVFNAADGRTITLGDGNGGGDIISDVFEDTTDPDNPVKKYNTVTFKGQGENSNIVANGIFDPFVANVDNVTLSRNNYDDEITY
ncbi:MAG: hypothetical protein ACI4B8_04600, partial [Candidatus Gastranaerophilaceae bacterium]